MSSDERTSPPTVDRGDHLAKLHAGWVTPSDLVRATVGGITGAEALDVRRIVAGEQNEVYDVALDRAPSVIVRIAQRRPEAHDRAVWVLEKCASRGIPAPRLHGRRHIEIGGEARSVMVMEKLPGERLSDLDPGALDLRRLLGEVGAWLAQLHSIPVTGFDYLDGSGVGRLATMDDWIDHIAEEAPGFEDAARSVGLDTGIVAGWVREILDALRTDPPAITLVHNDLQANHVLVHDGRLSGLIDFGEVAAQPTASDLAKWDFGDGDRFPVDWLQAGYGATSPIGASHDRTFRTLWTASGLWRMAWYHTTGFRPGVAAARDRLLAGSAR